MLTIGESEVLMMVALIEMPAESIHNLVRALSKPCEGAHFVYDDTFIKVWKTDIIIDKRNNFEPGKVVDINNEIYTIKAGTNSIKLLEVDSTLNLKLGDYL